MVCSVWDETGTGLGNLKFSVVSAAEVLGFVHHTTQWDENRKTFNVNRFGKEYNQTMDYERYRAMESPRPRGSNVFWPGEDFLLRAEVGGDAKMVSVHIVEYPKYSTILTASGQTTTKGNRIYKGSLWDESMRNLCGSKEPEKVTFRFVALYKDGTEEVHDVEVILDDSVGYWQLHRYQ